MSDSPTSRFAGAVGQSRSVNSSSVTVTPVSGTLPVLVATIVKSIVSPLALNVTGSDTLDTLISGAGVGPGISTSPSTSRSPVSVEVAVATFRTKPLFTSACCVMYVPTHSMDAPTNSESAPHGSDSVPARCKSVRSGSDTATFVRATPPVLVTVTVKSISSPAASKLACWADLTTLRSAESGGPVTTAESVSLTFVPPLDPLTVAVFVISPAVPLDASVT